MAKKNMNKQSGLSDGYRGRGALDAFLNLLSLISSGWLAWSLGAIIFQIVNKYFGTIVYGSTYFNEGLLKTGIASALIIGPVYFFVMLILHRQYKRGELSSASGVHRWLTYLMLLVSALSIIGSLIALISGFLNGDYTANVLLKIFTIIAIAGCIFGYYFYDLRRKDYLKPSLASIIAGSAVAVVAVAFVAAGFLSVTDPGLARKQQIDNQTIVAANNVYTMVVADFKNAGSLNQAIDLSQLTNSSDPEPYKRVAYRMVDKQQFELCADFLVSSPSVRPANYYSNYPEGIWANHKPGKACHVYDAKSEAASIYGEKPVPVSETANPAATSTK